MSYSFKAADQSVIQQDKSFFQPGESFTVMIWAKGNVNNNFTGIFLSFIKSSSTGDRFWMSIPAGIQAGSFYDAGGPNYDVRIDDAATPAPWKPWIVRFTQNTGTLDFFVGSESSSLTLSPGFNVQFDRTTIGGVTDSTPFYSDSKCEHFAGWDIALDDGFIQDLLNGKNPLDVASPVTYMPLIAGLDDVIGFYDNMQLVGSPPPVLTDDNAPVDRPDIITLWKWSGNDAAGNPVYNSTLEDLADGTTPGTIPTWIKINYAPPPGFGGGLVGGIVGGRQPGDSLLGRDQQGDLTGLTGNLLSNLTGLGNDFDSYDYWP